MLSRKQFIGIRVAIFAAIESLVVWGTFSVPEQEPEAFWMMVAMFFTVLVYAYVIIEDACKYITYYNYLEKSMDRLKEEQAYKKQVQQIQEQFKNQKS